MAYERGGRADKLGNRYEYYVVVYYLLELLNERIDYIVYEPIGEDEPGIDLWIGKKDNTREGAQCKVRYRSSDKWTYSALNEKGILSTWKQYLDRDSLITVSLISPLSFVMLDDLTKRARTTNDNPKDFYEYQVNGSGKDFVSFTKLLCDAFDIDNNKDEDIGRFIGYLKRIKYKQKPDPEETIIHDIEYLFVDDSRIVYDSLVSWIVDKDVFGKKITLPILYGLINEKGSD